MTYPSNVAGIFLADIHASLRPPLFRMAEPDWKEAMRRPLHEVRRIHEKTRAPVIIAGDVFDKPENPSELVNFMLKELPDCYGIPGQHDLLHHRYADRHKTSYQVLVEAGRVRAIEPGVPLSIGSLRLHGFPWGFDLCKLNMPPKSLVLDVAVVHAYCWTPETGYQGASDEHRLRSRIQNLAGYDAIVFGDNHKGFLNQKLRTFNCGTFLRRKLDEMNYRPCIGLLLSDGTWHRHYLDVSQDMTATETSVMPTIEKQMKSAETFMQGLSELQLTSFDFRQTVIRWMDDAEISDEVKQIVLICLEPDK